MTYQNSRNSQEELQLCCRGGWGRPGGAMRRAREDAPVDCCLYSPLTEPSSTTLHPAPELICWS